MLTIRRRAAVVAVVAGIACLSGCGERLAVPEISAGTEIAVPDMQFARASFVRGSRAQRLVVHDQFSGLARLYSAVDATEPEGSARWVSAPVGPAQVTLETISAVQSEDGLFHLVAVDRSYADLYYGTGASNSVVWRNIYPGYDVVSAVAPIVLDELGSPWIFFANQTSATVEAMHILADTTLVRTVVALGSATALAGGFDASGRGYIVWADAGVAPAIKVSVKSDAGWNTGNLWQGSADAVDFVAQASVNDIFLSYPRAVWHDVGGGDLLYAEQVSSSGWQVKVVDEPGQVGVDPRLTTDASGRSWIVHLDRNELNLRGSRQGEGGDWYSRILDSDGATGLWPDVSVDAQGDVQVVFFRADTRRLLMRPWGRYD